ncbi:NERD domain-containing protein [Caldibacillus lycopersici]|uniref:NERD domain-containing protein n=1 Tax=Perspicuibacillus lycopersici TaxID=1325689 RepID=A0AAE3IVQ0_9BACI|nr:NERD domain-containing protein [Perspicuibacillus lycopersici]MCU9614254.1 NERD domain-containing protein [Perspicuibacillus lycopersici]
MGQLVKLYEYISRYEMDIYKYPSRFIQLKRRQWDNLLEAWQSGNWQGVIGDEQIILQEIEEEHPPHKWRLLGKVKQLLSKREIESIEEMKDSLLPETVDDFSTIGRGLKQKPSTLDELKHVYLNEIFSVQMLWASSTLTYQSYIDSSFYRDRNLKYFAQRFPDTFLFLYKPIFMLKKAPVECETILLTPTGAICIRFLEEVDSTSFLGSDDRFWERRNKDHTSRFLNPLIGLNRTETIIQQIFRLHDIDFPLQKVLISRNGYIDYPSTPYGVQIVDKRNYQKWFESMRSLRSPLKHIQLKATKSLLDFCKSVAVSRNDWDK